MKCIKCEYQLNEGVDKCLRCGTLQSDGVEEVSGVSMELPKAENKKPASQKKPAAAQTDKSVESSDTSKKVDVADVVKEAGQKAQKSIKEAADKVAKASKKAAKNVGEAVEDAAEKVGKGGKKVWLYVLIGVSAAAVLLVIIFGLLSFDGTDDEPEYKLLAVSDDTVYVLEGDELIELIDDVPEGVSARELLLAIDGKSYYVIKDAEMDDDYGEYLGDLVLLKSNGKEIDIDDDVVISSQKLVGDILWYIKADKEESILCSYDGKKIIEVAQEEFIDNWFGTDKAGQAYLTIHEIKDYEYEYEVIYTSKGDSESIMQDARLFNISSDFKKALLITDDEELFIYDGKDDFEVMDDIVTVSVDLDTFNILIIEDEDDRQLYYVPYGKDEIELDDEVDAIVSMPYLDSSYTNEIGRNAYYIKDGNLYSIDLKGDNDERIVKDIYELQILRHDNPENEFVYVDDDEVVRINYHNFKEEEIKLPDAEDLMSRDIKTFGKWYVYRTEDNEELFAYNGKQDAIELSNDAEDISYFEIIFDGKYVLWKTTDDELIISDFKENSDEEIGDEVYNYRLTQNGEIYFINDYEDGEGDLYYISKIGKDAERIEKDISTIFILTYGE